MSDRNRALAAFVHREVVGLCERAGAAIQELGAEAVLPPSMILRVPPDKYGPRGVHFALLTDLLRVIRDAVDADGVVTDAELGLIYPLVAHVARIFARVRRAEYADFEALTPATTLAFLRRHAADGRPFGGADPESRWGGLAVCFRISRRTQDPAPLERYERLVLRLMDEIIALGDGVSHEEALVRRRLRDLIARRRLVEEQTSDPPSAQADLRAQVFLDPRAPEVFHAVAHARDVFDPDPFDVPTIHAEARVAFDRALDLTTRPERRAGRSLLVLGSAGSGKTHLMRAFRASLHTSRRGYAAYLQMSSRASSYARYVLQNVLDSLGRPYDPPELGETGLMCLSNALVERPEVPALDLLELHERELGADEVAERVGRITDALMAAPELGRADPHVLSALICLQRKDPALRARVVKYLRCEALTPYEQRLLGELPPRLGEEAPLRTLTELGQLVHATGGGALVLLVDPLEDMFNLEDAAEAFRRALDVFRHIQDHVPSALVVVACLEDYYEQVRGYASQAILDRLEHDPDPTRLTAARAQEDIEALVEARLAFLYEWGGAHPRPDESYAALEQLTGHAPTTSRAWPTSARGRCSTRAGATRIAAGPRAGSASRCPRSCAPPRSPTPTAAWSWTSSSAGTTCAARRPAARRSRSKSKRACSRGACAPWATRPRRAGPGSSSSRPTCSRRSSTSPARADTSSDAWPPSAPAPAPAPRRWCGELVVAGGRKVVAEDGDWRTLVAFQRFRERFGGDPGFATWVAANNPLLGVDALWHLLGAAPAAPMPAARQRPAPEPPAVAPEPAAPEPAAPPRAPTPPAAPASSEFTIGDTRALRPEPVTLAPGDLCTHAAFLGSTGSGKTTLALSVVEQLLLRGVPAILVDRKGDLAAYADPDAWATPSADPELERRRQALTARLDVVVYTPGEDRGQPLAIPVVPAGLHALSSSDRTQVARYAASSLASMMGLRDSQGDRARVSILAKAIELLGSGPLDPAPGLDALSGLLHRRDPDLVNAIGRLDTRHFGKLVEGLETLRLSADHLFRATDPQLSPDAMLGPAPDGRTRLTVISTKFLTDIQTIDFWVARLLVEMSRWAARSPSGELQAVLLLDEADIYLPAVRKPATKEPLLDLLKRGRSAGLGVLLATQSPGDLDYQARHNVNTWFLGRVAEQTAIAKMKPLFSECRVPVAERLPQCGTGEFFRVRGGAAVQLKAHRSALETRQLPEDRILALARATRVSGAR